MLRNTTRQEEESKRVALGGDHRQQSCDRGGTGAGAGQRPRASGRQNGTSKTAASALYECVRVMMIERREPAAASERTAANTVRSV